MAKTSTVPKKRPEYYSLSETLLQAPKLWKSSELRKKDLVSSKLDWNNKPPGASGGTTNSCSTARGSSTCIKKQLNAALKIWWKSYKVGGKAIKRSMGKAMTWWWKKIMSNRNYNNTRTNPKQTKINEWRKS